MKASVYYLILFCLVTPIVQAQLALDKSFNKTGIVKSTVQGTAVASVVLSNQKILVLTKTALIRFNQNGNIDSTFGTNGMVDSLKINPNDMLVQPDNKILIAGGHYDYIISRYLSDGRIDSSFGNNGIMQQDVSSDYSNIGNPAVRRDHIDKLILQPDGKILAGGFGRGTCASGGTWGGCTGWSSCSEGPTIRRYHPDGRLDTTFAETVWNTGSNIQPIIWAILSSFQGNGLSDMQLQADGKIIIATTYGLGIKNLGPNCRSGQMVYVRYHKNGLLDSTFNSKGYKFQQWGSIAFCSELAIQKNGKILGAGLFVDTNGLYGIGLSRLMINGVLDSTFGQNGFVFNTLDTSAPEITDIELDTLDRILVAGKNKKGDFFLARFTPNGILDSTCQLGSLTTDVDSNDIANTIHVLQNGKLLITGSSDSSISIARYQKDWLRHSSKSDTACGQVNFNGKTYSHTGNYLDTVTNAKGCDSLIQLKLDILPEDSIYHSISNCYSYTYLSNTYTQSGQYTDTLKNKYGCDSIVHLDLIIHPRETSSLKTSNCDSYTLLGKNYSKTGNYSDTLQSIHGCDSVVHLDLTIHHQDSSQLTDQACDVYSFNGIDYTSTGVFSDTLQTIHGCDSVVTLDLSITHIDSSVIHSKDTLSAVDSATSYQWIHCASGLPINGATSKTFVATQNGDYAVEITKGNCTETSACYSIRSVGIEGQILSANNLKVYPNPNNGSFQIELGELNEPVQVQVFNIQGQLVFKMDLEESPMRIDLDQPAGSYLLRISSQSQTITQRVQIQ